MRYAIRSRRSVLPSIYVAAAATQPVVKSRLGIESSVRAGTIILPVVKRRGVFAQASRLLFVYQTPGTSRFVRAA